MFDKEAFEWSPAGSKVITGLVVLVESIKFSDAQNRPDKALFSVIHLANALEFNQLCMPIMKELPLTPCPYLLPPKPKAQRLFLLPWRLPEASRPNSLHPIFQS